MKTKTIVALLYPFIFSASAATAQIVCMNPVVDGSGERVVLSDNGAVTTNDMIECETPTVEVTSYVTLEDPLDIIYVYTFEPYELSDADARRKIEKATESIFFEFDKAKIRQSGYPILDDVAKAMKSTEKFNLVIEGHADKRGTAAYNRDLGMDRAKEVRKYLLKKGVDRNRLMIRSYGETDPVSEDPKFNRRVEFFITK